jgi:hypothetical protein
MTPKSLKIATYNVHGWFDGEGKHNLERVLQLYRKHSSQLSPSLSLQYGHCPYSHGLHTVLASNVKTVKDKGSTNIPQTFRHLTGMKPKCLSFPSRICPIERDHVYLVSGEQILDQIETICSEQGKFGIDTKTFRFLCQNDIGTLSFHYFWQYWTSFQGCGSSLVSRWSGFGFFKRIGSGFRGSQCNFLQKDYMK